jgi:Fe-S-cluster containining protein
MTGSGVNSAGCATCKGRCCREYRVEVTVADVRVLADRTGLHPRDFIALQDAAAGNGGFRLRPAGPAKELHLVRNTSTGACVFLMEIAPDRARCGVYAYRPVVCRVYPTFLKNGTVAVRDGAKCGPDAWNLAAMDLTTCRRDHTRNEVDKTEHRNLVTAWNARVDADGQERSADELLEFVLSGVPGDHLAPAVDPG